MGLPHEAPECLAHEFDANRWTNPSLNYLMFIFLKSDRSETWLYLYSPHSMSSGTRVAFQNLQIMMIQTSGSGQLSIAICTDLGVLRLGLINRVPNNSKTGHVHPQYLGGQPPLDPKPPRASIIAEVPNTKNNAIQNASYKISPILLAVLILVASICRDEFVVRFAIDRKVAQPTNIAIKDQPGCCKIAQIALMSITPANADVQFMIELLRIHIALVLTAAIEFYELHLVTATP